MVRISTSFILEQCYIFSVHAYNAYTTPIEYNQIDMQSANRVERKQVKQINHFSDG